MRYHFTPVRMAISKQCIVEGVEKGEPFCTVGGNADWGSHCGKQYELPQKIKNGTASWPSDSTPECVAKEICNTNLKDYVHPCVLCSVIYNSEDLEAAQVSVSRRVDKRAMVHLYNGISLGRKKENFTVAIAWMDLENITLSEISQSEKDEYMWFHSGVESNERTTRTSKIETDSHREQMTALGVLEGGGQIDQKRRKKGKELTDMDNSAMTAEDWGGVEVAEGMGGINGNGKNTIIFFKENKSVNLKEVHGQFYLLSFPFRTWSPDLWLLEQGSCRWRPWGHEPQAGTAGTQRRRHRADPIRHVRETWTKANAHPSQADFILKLHTSGATNKLLGIFILQGLSNMN